jgi:hypothetical protein
MENKKENIFKEIFDNLIFLIKIKIRKLRKKIMIKLKNY